MNNIKDINQSLVEEFEKLDCKVSINGKLLYEGKFKNDLEFPKKNKSQIVYEFNINNDNVYMLADENNNIVELKKLFEGKKFEDMKTNPLLYNKAMELANKLPLYNLEIVDESLKKDIKKHGLNYRKVYENLIIDYSNDEKQDVVTDDYDKLIEELKKAKEENIPIEEGLLGAIGGAILGSTIGPKLGNAICKALGVDPKGSFGNLLTSRLVMGAIGTTMGWKL